MTRASLLFAGEVGEETAERGVILPLCILCDSEASEAKVDAGQKVTCPLCQQYILAEGLAADLAKDKDWPQFRSKVARAVRWQFYRNGQQPVKLRSATSAEWLVASLEVFEEDPERRERAAVEAFVSAWPIWGHLGRADHEVEPSSRPVARAITCVRRRPRGPRYRSDRYLRNPPT